MLGSWFLLASVPLVGVSSMTVVTDRKERAFVSHRLCSFDRRWLSHSGGWPIVKGVGLVSPLLHWSSWAQSLG